MTTNRQLTQLRSKRTRAINVVRSSMQFLLTEPAKWAITGQPVGPDFVGLPSWWPFWSDVLKANVREAVRAARAVAQAEGNPILGYATTDEDEALNWRRIRS